MRILDMDQMRHFMKTHESSLIDIYAEEMDERVRALCKGLGINIYKVDDDGIALVFAPRQFKQFVVFSVEDFDSMLLKLAAARMHIFGSSPAMLEVPAVVESIDDDGCPLCKRGIPLTKYRG